MVTTKRCACCKEFKTLEHFTKYKPNKDGLFSYCKVCKAIKAKQDYIKNNDRVKAYAKEYNKNIPEKVKLKKKISSKIWYEENREVIREKQKKFYKENTQKVLKRNRESYQRTKDKLKTTRKRWEENNRAKRLEIVTRRKRIKITNGIFKVTEKDIRRLLSKNCYICKSSPSKHLDHIIPLSKGGRHSVGNLAGSCAKCNLSKSDKLLIEYKKDL